MTPNDFCPKCQGVGKLLTRTSVERCPKCRGTGWDPEKVAAAGGDFEAIVSKVYEINHPEKPVKGKYGRR
jgi:DnaJ-class molecular chaperone